MEAPAQRLANAIRVLIEDDRTTWDEKERLQEFPLYPEGDVTRESDVGIDEGSAIFTVLFEGREYEVTVSPGNHSS